jgi:hypothetical protein
MAVGATALVCASYLFCDDPRFPRAKLVLKVASVVLIFALIELVTEALQLPQFRFWIGLAALAVVSLFIYRSVERLGNDSVGGVVFDVVFNEGAFAERVTQPKDLPNMTLLRHWRETGMVKQAYREACKGLVAEPEAFGVWLFAAETAALHLNEFGAARRLIKKLCANPGFPDDQKRYAMGTLQSWAAITNRSLEERLLPRLDFGRARSSTHLTEAHDLRIAGKPKAAAACLRSALWKKPDDLTAVFQLVLLLARDMRDFEGAEGVVNAVAKRPFTPPAFVDYARATIQEQRKLPTPVLMEPEEAPDLEGEAAPDAASEPSDPASKDQLVDELLAEGKLGSAVERLQLCLEKYPTDLDGWMKLAHVYFNVCDQRKTAEKLIAGLHTKPYFTPEQKADAEALLRQWRAARPKQAAWVGRG